MDSRIILPKVKTAVRIRNSTVYDDEIALYISTVESECRRLGLEPSELDPDFQTACIAFVKMNFGASQTADKAIWQTIYQNAMNRMFMDMDRRPALRD